MMDVSSQITVFVGTAGSKEYHSGCSASRPGSPDVAVRLREALRYQYRLVDYTAVGE